MALTTEQVLLLNNLMYMYGAGDPLASADQYTGQTIGSWIKNIPAESLQANKDYGSFMTGKDWNDIIQAVKNDETLMNMTVKTTHTDWESGGGGGFSAVFVSEDTGDAVVGFRKASGCRRDVPFRHRTGGSVTERKSAVQGRGDEPDPRKAEGNGGVAEAPRHKGKKAV